MLLIIQNKKYFLHWKRELTNFIWAGKKPRIKYKVLCDSKGRGGLGLPDLELYHDACALTWIQEWILVQNKKITNIRRIQYKIWVARISYVWQTEGGLAVQSSLCEEITYTNMDKVQKILTSWKTIMDNFGRGDTLNVQWCTRTYGRNKEKNLKLKQNKKWKLKQIGGHTTNTKVYFYKIKNYMDSIENSQNWKNN